MTDPRVLCREICERWPDWIEIHGLAHTAVEHAKYNDYLIRQMHTQLVVHGDKVYPPGHPDTDKIRGWNAPNFCGFPQP
jgi:hypothetical protein